LQIGRGARESALNVKLIIAAIHIGAAWFLVALSVPFIRRKIRPNTYWGFIRTRRMVEHAEVWYPVNEYAGKLMIGVATAASTSAFVLLFVPGLDPGAYALIQTGVLIGLLALLVAVTFRYLSRL
jgi:SdpI/YfhL protein family